MTIVAYLILIAFCVVAFLLIAIGVALERIAEVLERIADGKRAVKVDVLR